MRIVQSCLIMSCFFPQSLRWWFCIKHLWQGRNLQMCHATLHQAIYSKPFSASFPPNVSIGPCLFPEHAFLRPYQEPVMGSDYHTVKKLPESLISTPSTLLQACLTVYDEALPLFHKANIFDFVMAVQRLFASITKQALALIHSIHLNLRLRRSPVLDRLGSGYEYKRM